MDDQKIFIMQSLLCHSCFKRIGSEEKECEFCGAQIKDDIEDKVIVDFINSLTKIAKDSHLRNYPEFYLLILINFIISFHLFSIASLSIFFEIDNVDYISLSWYIPIVYFLTFISIYSTLGLISRRSSVIGLLLFQVLLHLIFFTKMIYDMKTLIMLVGTEEVPGWIYFINKWSTQFGIFAIFIAILYSMQIYLVLFNPQVRKCLSYR